VFRNLNDQSKFLIKSHNKDFYRYLYKEEDVKKLYKYMYGKNQGEPDTISTYVYMTDILNDWKKFGLSDQLFGLYQGK
jgi:hypothetical protein